MLAAGPLGINLSSIDYVDVMKDPSGEWTQYGPAALTRDASGWPTSDAAIVAIDARVDQPWNGPDSNAVQRDIGGTYRLSFHGQATVARSWDGIDTIANQVYNAQTNITTADVVVTHNAYPFLEVPFTGTSNRESPTGAGVSGVKLYQPGYSLDSAQVFTTDFLNDLKPFGTLRDLLINDANNYAATTDSGGKLIPTDWSQRRLPSDSSQNQAYNGRHGQSWEYMVALANATNTDMWINVPDSATDDYVRQLAGLIKGGDTVGGVRYAGLNPNLRVYLEYSNEAWGGIPTTANYNLEAARQQVAAGGSTLNNDGNTDKYTWGGRYYLQRTKQIVDDFRAVFGADPTFATIRPVLGWQEQNTSYYTSTFPWFQKNYGAPSLSFYGMGNADYWSPTDYSSADAILKSLAAEEAKTLAITAQFTAIADFYGLKNVSYEGGPGLAPYLTAAQGQNELAASRDPRMESLVSAHLLDWFAAGGDQIAYFNGPYEGWSPAYGMWGAAEPWQEANPSLAPKYRGLMDVAAAAPPALTAGIAVSNGGATNIPVAADILNQNFTLPNDGQQNFWLLNAPSAGSYHLSLATAPYPGSTSNYAPGLVEIFVGPRSIGTYSVPQGATVDLGTLPLQVGYNSLVIQTIHGRYDPAYPSNPIYYQFQPTSLTLTPPTPAPAPTPVDTAWVDDSAPAGASLVGSGGDSWTWAATNPTPYTGSLDLQSSAAAGVHQIYFVGASAPLAVAAADSLYAYVYLDPANPPAEVMLQWNDGSWEHRAYWGADNIAWGAPGTAGRQYVGSLPAAGSWARLQVPASRVGLAGSSVTGMAFTLYGGRAAWDDAGKTTTTTPALTPAPAPADTAWVDDSAPAGASLVGSGGDSWTWAATNPAPYTGSLDLQSSAATGIHQIYFVGASAPLAVAAADSLYAYVYLDPANPPAEVMLQWNDGSWEHRAYWGADNIAWGAAGTAGRQYVGALPAAGSWARLQVPASRVGLAGSSVTGMAFTLYGGRAAWDDAGKTT